MRGAKANSAKVLARSALALPYSARYRLPPFNPRPGTHTPAPGGAGLYSPYESIRFTRTLCACHTASPQQMVTAKATRGAQRSTRRVPSSPPSTRYGAARSPGRRSRSSAPTSGSRGSAQPRELPAANRPGNLRKSVNANGVLFLEAPEPYQLSAGMVFPHAYGKIEAQPRGQVTLW